MFKKKRRGLNSQKKETRLSKKKFEKKRKEVVNALKEFCVKVRDLKELMTEISRKENT